MHVWHLVSILHADTVVRPPGKASPPQGWGQGTKAQVWAASVTAHRHMQYESKARKLPCKLLALASYSMRLYEQALNAAVPFDRDVEDEA